jgi:hypothetical protein
MTTTTPKIRSGVAGLLGAGAVILGAMTVTAPIASATNVEQNCRNLGGTYTSDLYSDRDHYYETCCYPSLNPKVPGTQCDHYVDGKFAYNRPPTTPPSPTHKPPVVAPAPAPKPRPGERG